MRSYHTYILSNAHRTVLYIGVTNDLSRRLSEHRTGTASAFVARYNVTDLMLYESFGNVNDAIAREKQLKRWHRDWKWNLVHASNPELRDLAPELIHLR